jgi:hypothetical protein
MMLRFTLTIPSAFLTPLPSTRVVLLTMCLRGRAVQAAAGAGRR